MTNRVDPDRVAELTKSLEESLRLRTHKSGEFVEEAKQVLPGGVASSFQEHAPHPIYIVEGHGSKVTDLDGNEYSDFHNGFGVMVVGHAHPLVAAAIADTATKGTHFAAPNASAASAFATLCWPRIFSCLTGSNLSRPLARYCSPPSSSKPY